MQIRSDRRPPVPYPVPGRTYVHALCMYQAGRPASYQRSAAQHIIIIEAPEVELNLIRKYIDCTGGWCNTARIVGLQAANKLAVGGDTEVAVR